MHTNNGTPQRGHRCLLSKSPGERRRSCEMDASSAFASQLPEYTRVCFIAKQIRSSENMLLMGGGGEWRRLHQTAKFLYNFLLA